jgi:electron transfer flavoprotein alpha subunit
MTEQSIIVIAEHMEGQVRPVTYELVECALRLQGNTMMPIKVFILGEDVADLAREIAENSGQDVSSIQAPGLVEYHGEAYRYLLEQLLNNENARYVCVAHSSQGLDFGPALAVLLGADCITGVEDLYDHDGQLIFIRPIYGGKVVSHVSAKSETTILCIQAGIFKPSDLENRKAGSVLAQSLPSQTFKTRSLGIKQAEADTSGIAEAEVLISAGMGIGDEENLEVIYALADLFPKSAVAGSRIVCDLGWLEYKCQVGVTGATVSPELYFACGISGAVQHVSGMRGSGFIVALNTDPAAAIFHTADVCIVEDLKTFIPAFIEAYERERDN